MTDLQLLLFNPPTMRNEALERAVELAGGQTDLARRIGGKVKQQHVHQWIAKGVVSERHVIAVAAAVDFQVTPHELDAVLYPNPSDGLPAPTEKPIAEHASALGRFYLHLPPEQRVAFDQEIEAAKVRGLVDEALVAEVHASAQRRGATFSLDEMLAEFHDRRWNLHAERVALTLLPADLRLVPGQREVQDRQFVKSQSKDFESVPAGPAPIGNGAAA